MLYLLVSESFSYMGMLQIQEPAETLDSHHVVVIYRAEDCVTSY